MQKNYLSFLCVICLSCGLLAQKADDILGLYYCQDPFTGEESQIQIYKETKNSYSGKVVWVKNEKNVTNEGLEFLKDLKYDKEKNEWIGKITYPGKSGVFDTYISIISDKQLKVRGYWVFSLFGKTVYWIKEEQKRTH